MFKSVYLNDFYDMKNAKKEDFGSTVFKEFRKFKSSDINELVKTDAWIYEYRSLLHLIFKRYRCIPHYKELFRYLVSKGGDINLKDSHGRSLLDYAKDTSELLNLLCEFQ